MEKSPIQLPEGFVDLGEKMKSYAMPDMMHEAKESSAQEAEEHFHYPSLYFEDAEGLDGLATEGTATIHYKKVMEKTVTENRDGKNSTRYCLELQINGLKPGKADKNASSSSTMKEDEDAIEEGLSSSEDYEQDED